MEKIYLGFYQNEILAVSDQKTFVEIYLSIIRKLKPKEYTIQKRVLDSNAAYHFYSDYILDQYYEFILPAIDIMIIENDNQNLPMQIDGFLETMRIVLALSAKSDKLEDLHTKLQEDMQYYGNILHKKKVIRTLEKNLYQSHPLLHCGIEEYLQTREIFRDTRDMDYEYHLKMDTD